VFLAQDVACVPVVFCGDVEERADPLSAEDEPGGVMIGLDGVFHSGGRLYFLDAQRVIQLPRDVNQAELPIAEGVGVLPHSRARAVPTYDFRSRNSPRAKSIATRYSLRNL
jgi:hypothetical protein